MGGCLSHLMHHQDLKHYAIDRKHLYATFCKEYPNGYISHDDLNSAFAKKHPNGDATKLVDHVFRAFKKNENGQIGFDEFVWAVEVTRNGTLEQKLKWTFSVYDVDGDGLITREEMFDVLDAFYAMRGTSEEMPEGEATPLMATDKVFTELDENNTGVLTFEQFFEGAKNDDDIREILQCHYRGPPAPRIRRA